MYSTTTTINKNVKKVILPQNKKEKLVQSTDKSIQVQRDKKKLCEHVSKYMSTFQQVNKTALATKKKNVQSTGKSVQIQLDEKNVIMCSIIYI